MKKLLFGLLVLSLAAPAGAATELQVLMEALACDSDGILFNFIKLSAQGDHEAAIKLGAVAIHDGRCVNLKPGETVVFEGVSGGSWQPKGHYTLKVRRKGDFKEYCVMDQFVSGEWNRGL